MNKEPGSTLSLIRPVRDQDAGSPRNTFSHEIILKGYIKNCKNIRLTLTSGEIVEGRVTQFDDETITVIPLTADAPSTYFKHSVESFCTTATQQ